MRKKQNSKEASSHASHFLTFVKPWQTEEIPAQGF